MEEVMRFALGENGQSYPMNSLTPTRVKQSRRTFPDFVTDVDLRDMKFAGIGYDQGSSLIAMAQVEVKFLFHKTGRPVRS
ncbi:MAG: hypothetical protein M1418_03910 [Deltaproteobacteria bacterium]|nr:hypothetical protein [Deltaproteobacteria bacterium]